VWLKTPMLSRSFSLESCRPRRASSTFFNAWEEEKLIYMATGSGSTYLHQLKDRGTKYTYFINQREKDCGGGGILIRTTGEKA
jgi:hypothetical protein